MADIDQYRRMLKTNKHRLDDELEIQAEVMERIASEVTKLNSKMIEAKEQLTQTEAKLFREIKDEDPKCTVDAANAALRTKKDRISKWEQFQLARHEHEEWQGLYESWKQKGYALKDLCELYGVQYFSLESHQKEQKQEAVQEVRRSIREASLKEEMRQKEEASRPSKRRTLL